MVPAQPFRFVLALVVLTIGACASGPNRVGNVQYWNNAPPVHIRPLYDTLEQLVEEQAAFYRANGFFHESVTELDVTTPPGTTVGIEADDQGWSAVAQSPAGAECAVFIGQVRRIPTALGITVPRAGRILCAEQTGVGR